MRKAFLCHASKDKGYVDIVAQKLGRAKVVFDAMHFAPGEDFRVAIQSGLDDTRVFVFLVSPDSLASVWCRHEVNEAEFRRLNESIDRCLTIIIDRTVRYADLPQWLQRTKAVIQTRPSQAVRDIQHALFATLPAGETHPFIGRATASSSFARALAAFGRVSPHMLVATGLEGIGRRSFLQRVCFDCLSLNLGPFFHIDETRDLTDVYLWALDETSEFGSRIELAAETAQFQQLSGDAQVSEITSRLQVMCQDRCLPCFVDEGGLLRDSGEYHPTYASLFESFLTNHQDGYLAIVHRRKPQVGNLPFEDSILLQRITPLEPHETRLLLTQLIRRQRSDVPEAKVTAVADFLSGYPPAIYFAATYVSEYGLDALVADTNTLIDFKAGKFLRFLSELKLRELDWQIARYLAAEQLLPIEGIAIAFDRSSEDIAASLRTLIDCNLVVVFDDKYQISGPIRDTVRRARGNLTAGEYERIRVNLTKGFWADEGAAPSVEIVDATLHAVAMSGSTDFDSYGDLVRVSTIHRLANESYYRKDWAKALEYAKRVEIIDPERRGIRHVKFKALVQLEEWDAAKSVLEELRIRNDRLTFFLEGFMLRKRNRFEDACRAFQSALDAGDRSYPVYRDYADCLNRLGRNAEALEKIKWVLDRDSENIFVLDLMCRICIDGQMLEEAGSVLQSLERCDVDRRFIHHRRASWLASKGSFVVALDEATKACDSGHALFESHAQRCDILIELSRFEDALKELDRIVELFGKTVRRDVQSGLRVKLLVRQKQWREAMVVWQGLEETNSPMLRILRARILQVKAFDGTVSLSERSQAQEEAKQIEADIQHEKDYRVWIYGASGEGDTESPYNDAG